MFYIFSITRRRKNEHCEFSQTGCTFPIFFMHLTVQAAGKQPAISSPVALRM